MASRTRRTKSQTRVNPHALAPLPPKPSDAHALVTDTFVSVHPNSLSPTNHNHTPGKRQEIFAAALRLFQEKGYHGASMQDLAEAMGMQKASLYYYIRSKEELLVQVCERGTGTFTQELNEIVASEASATEKLQRAIESYLVALCGQLDLFTVFLREQKFLGDAQKRKLRGEGKHHADLLAAILEQGIAAGDFRPVNVTVTTLAILGMCNWLYEWYSPNGALKPREIAEMFSSLILNGLMETSSPRATIRPKKTIQ